MVSVVLDYISAGESEKKMLKQYPNLTRKDIRAAISYAAWLTREEEEHPLCTRASS